MIQCFLELVQKNAVLLLLLLEFLLPSMVLEDVQHIFRVNGSLVEAIDAH